jgi:TonB family protein
MMLGIMLGLLLAQASPSPSPSPSYSECSHEADVVKPEEPDPTHMDIGPGSPDLFAIVAVAVAPNGSVVKAKIYRSSGDLIFDEASVHAARRSTYKPKVVDCKPVEGIVYFKTSLTGGYPPGPEDKPTPPVWPKDMSPPPRAATAS